MVTEAPLHVEVSQGVGYLRLDRPEKRNALSEQLRDEMEARFRTFATDDEVRVTALTGGRGIFSAGFDLGEVVASGFATFAHRFVEYNEAIYGHPKPIVVGVGGPALAGGLDLALAGDVIIASETATFGHPEVEFGAVPSLALLHPRVGLGRARELCLTGRIVSAEEALRIGLVDRLVPDDLLQDELRNAATTLAKRSLSTLRGIRATGWSFPELMRSLTVEYQATMQAVADPENRRRLESYFANLTAR